MSESLHDFTYGSVVLS